MHYSYLKLLKHYVKNPREFYSRLKGVIFCFFLGIYYKFSDKVSEINSEKSAYSYINSRYGKFLDDLPKYKESKERENIIWWCRLQGEENAPKLNKSCLKSIRKFVKNKKIIILTEKNIEDYVKFPDYIQKKYKDGIISRTHFSDLLRTELLIKYGGTWIDSSVLLTDYNKEFFESEFFVFKSDNEYSALSSWFITSNKSNPILLATRDLLYEYWKYNDYLLHYFLFHLFFTLATKKYPKIWNKVPKYSNIPPHTMQREFLQEYNKERFKELKKISSVHKLNHKINRKNLAKNSLFEYIENM